MTIDLRFIGAGQRMFIACLLAGWCVGTLACPTNAADDDPIKSRFQILAESIKISASGDSPQPLDFSKQPALSWSNPERQTPAGAMFLWTLRGRPHAAICFYPNVSLIDIECQSLSDGPLIAEVDDQMVWQPESAGVHFSPLESAPVPARSLFLRLRQMRNISREFTARLVPPNKNPIELRMLGTPVYRYQLDDDSPARDGLIDGAVFCFVQGTDPEVLVLVEAFQQGEQRSWRYALARMSIVPTQVRHQSMLIWETDWAIKRPSTPYWVYRVQQDTDQ